MHVECRGWFKVVLDTRQGECSGEASRQKRLLQLVVSSHFAWALSVALGTWMPRAQLKSGPEEN